MIIFYFIWILLSTHYTLSHHLSLKYTLLLNGAFFFGNELIINHGLFHFSFFYFLAVFREVRFFWRDFSEVLE